MLYNRQIIHLQTILNASPDIVVLKDAKGRWLETNKRTLDIFGIDEYVYKGKTEQELGKIYPHYAQFVPCFLKSDQQAWEAGKQIQVEETILIEGKEHIFEVIKIPVYDEHGRPDAIFVTGRDITDRLESEQRYKSLFIEHPDAVYSLDLNGEFLDVNKEAERISGYKQEELLGMDFTPLIVSEDLSRIMQVFEEVKNGQPQSYETKIVRKDGKIRDVYFKTIPASLQGRIIGIHGIAKDITDKKQSEAIRGIQTRILAMIALGEPLSDILHNILDAAEAQSHECVCSVMFYEEEHNRLRVGYAPRLPDGYKEKIDKMPVGLYQGSCGYAAYIKNLVIVRDIESDPSWRKWAKTAISYGLRSCWSVPILSNKGSLLGTFAIYYKRMREPESYEVEMWRALSYLAGLAMERNKHEKDIQYLALHDALTNLPNLRYLKDIFENAIQKSKESGNKLAIMFLDLDQFKPINDTFGHAFGDLILQEIARRIHQIIGEDNIVTRMGGDEFIVLLPDLVNEQAAYSITDEILQGIEQPILIDNQEFHVTTSIGISMYPDHGDTIDILMRNADVAMYSVKDHGGNASRMYNQAMTEQVRELFMLQGEFRRALKQEQFLLYYQPKVNTETGTVIGMEALVRWKHPEKGLISPATFIPLAEESGFILDLGAWVLREACMQIKTWKETDILDVPIAVNISVRQFVQQDVVTLVRRTLNEIGVPPCSLEIEITESVLAQHEHIIQDAVTKLQEIGVRVSIDDFGTGYASLTYLKQFRANTIKVDRSFISSLPHNQDDAAIVSAVITLADNFDMDVVAEGVETKEQAEFLLSKGCSKVQGYYYSPPLPVDELYKFLKRFRDKQVYI